MASHHPAPEMLTAFSAGSLQLGHAMCVSAHVEHCSECQSNLQRLNTLGAELAFRQLEPARASDELKSNVLSMLDRERPKPEARPPARSDVPRCLHKFMDDFESLEWQRVSPSIQTAVLCRDEKGAQVSMLRIKPGGEIGTHEHTGDELTMVLKGAFSDETGIYAKGDFVLRDKSHKHRPIVTKDSECICLTVVDAPIQFTGFFSRILNPLLRKSHLAS